MNQETKCNSCGEKLGFHISNHRDCFHKEYDKVFSHSDKTLKDATANWDKQAENLHLYGTKDNPSDKTWREKVIETMENECLSEEFIQMFIGFIQDLLTTNTIKAKQEERERIKKVLLVFKREILEEILVEQNK